MGKKRAKRWLTSQPALQCLCLPPEQWQPQPPPPLLPQEGAGAAAPATEEANTESRFESLVDPQ
jgi:hypothetical protein